MWYDKQKRDPKERYIVSINKELILVLEEAQLIQKEDDRFKELCRAMGLGCREYGVIWFSYREQISLHGTALYYSSFNSCFAVAA